VAETPRDGASAARGLAASMESYLRLVRNARNFSETTHALMTSGGEATANR
jgi:hypothetical protein